MNKPSTIPGILDEYCWTHQSGGWDCPECFAQDHLTKFFAVLVAILDEALAAHDLLPSKVQQFEVGSAPADGCWIDFDEEYYTWVLMQDGKLTPYINGRSTVESEM